MSNTDTCQTCHFSHDASGQLQCRRYPPAIVLTQEVRSPIDPQKVGFRHLSDFPPTRPDNSCGEYRAQISVHE